MSVDDCLYHYPRLFGNIMYPLAEPNMPSYITKLSRSNALEGTFEGFAKEHEPSERFSRRDTTQCEG